MATANEIVRDGLTRHQLRILRFSRSLEREIVELLTRPNARLRDMIEAFVRQFPATGFRAGSAERRLREFEKRLAKLYGPLETETRALVRERLVDFAVREAEFTRNLLLTTIPVELDLGKPTKRELRNAVRSFPHEGQPLTAWVAGLWAGDRTRVLGEIRQGLAFDESQSEIVRRVFGRRSLRGRDGIRNVAAHGAATLARTLVNSTAHLARGRVYDKTPAIDLELYVATLDSRTTAICRSLDGETFPQGEGPRPPLHRNCRSLRVPVVDAERLGTRPANAAVRRDLAGLRGPERRELVAQMVGRVPETQTYSTFLRNQSVAFQNEALGVTKAKLFRKGGLTLDRFVDPTGRELNLDELYRLEPDAFARAGVPAP